MYDIRVLSPNNQEAYQIHLEGLLTTALSFCLTTGCQMTFDTSMEQHEHRMLVYITLADFSSRKLQPAGRDRFLILAGVAACESGWLDVATRCRELVLENNPQHLIGRYESIPDGLRDTAFQPFLTQLERLCPMERAEHFLREWNLTPLNWPDKSNSSAGEFAMGMLADIDPSPQ